MTDLSSIQRPATAVRAAIAVAVLGALLSACGADRVPGKPAMSAHEATQHDRCIALLRPMLHGQPVRSTSIERGPNGLDYVWINAEAHDDADDVERRVAKGARFAGHCQFDASGESVHLHAYALEAGDAPATPAVDYRFVAGSRERVASADPR